MDNSPKKLRTVQDRHATEIVIRMGGMGMSGKMYDRIVSSARARAKAEKKLLIIQWGSSKEVEDYRHYREEKRPWWRLW